jgi:predicted nucleic acid-binding Zn ribbon protein
MTIPAPVKRKSRIAKNGASTRQWEIHQGTKPAKNPGAMTRKIAEPRIAHNFLIARSSNLRV